MADESHPKTPDASSGDGKPTSPPAPPKKGWKQFFHRCLKRLLIFSAIFILLGVVVFSWAEHETSQPEFCGSCHIMEPYYESWHNDVHGGKLEVACVECHYAPGERNTLTAKLRGLSQVASYFSGRYGKTRPRAYVDKRSCMTSNCHGDMKFMDEVLTLGTVKFTHRKHLEFDEAKKQANQKDLEQITQSIRNLLGPDRFQELEAVATQAVPEKQRMEKLTSLVGSWNVALKREQIERFSALHHMQVRIAQLADLQCTNCHSYGAPDQQSKDEAIVHLFKKENATVHFSVKTTSCYTCHFNNEGFDTGTGRCLLCHTLPTKEILIHPELSPEKSKKINSPELTKKTVRMDHQMILERKVSCISCHADVAMEDSMVTKRDCERCHDNPSYFDKWKQPLSLDTVQYYHKEHVPEQRAKCLDCHSEIHHQLVKKDSASGKPGFLAFSLSNCTHCHPNQHAEQVQLLSGVGGTGVAKANPNFMFGSRTNCFGCHVSHPIEDSDKQSFKGTLSGCIACHGDRHSETFEKWKLGLQITLMDAEEAYASAWKMFENTKNIQPAPQKKAAELLNAAKSDLVMVKRGNGIHNVMYSIELLDSVAQRCREAMAILSEANQKP